MLDWDDPLGVQRNTKDNGMDPVIVANTMETNSPPLMENVVQPDAMHLESLAQQEPTEPDFLATPMDIDDQGNVGLEDIEMGAARIRVDDKRSSTVTPI